MSFITESLQGSLWEVSVLLPVSSMLSSLVYLSVLLLSVCSSIRPSPPCAHPAARLKVKETVFQVWQAVGDKCGLSVVCTRVVPIDQERMWAGLRLCQFLEVMVRNWDFIFGSVGSHWTNLSDFVAEFIDHLVSRPLNIACHIFNGLWMSGGWVREPSPSASFTGST